MKNNLLLTVILLGLIALISFANVKLWFKLHTNDSPIDHKVKERSQQIRHVSTTGERATARTTFAATSHAEKVDNPNAGCVNLSGYDFQGYDIYAHAISITDPAQCCAACNAVQNCAGWVFSAPDACWVKHNTSGALQPSPTSNQKLVAGHRCTSCGSIELPADKLPKRDYLKAAELPVQGDLAGFDGPCARGNFDILGSDIMGGYFHVHTPDDCCKACNMRSDCKAWTLAHKECWLKGAVSTIKPKSSVTSGSKCPECGMFPNNTRECTETPSDECAKAIKQHMGEAKAATAGCKYKGSYVLPDDLPDVYQRYLSEQDDAHGCIIPCSQISQAFVDMTMSIDRSEATNDNVLTIGIPSACREQSKFLILANRTATLAPRETKFVCWQSHGNSYSTQEATKLSAIGYQVNAHKNGYPPIYLYHSLGDSFARVRWRSTEVLDYANTLKLAYEQQSKYILILQDDTFVAPNFGKELNRAIEALESIDPQFGMLSLYTGSYSTKIGIFEQTVSKTKSLYYGREGQAVALLYRREVIPDLCRYITRHYIEYPVDWMIYGYIGHLHEPPLKIYGVIPNLVQHVGKISTGQHVKSKESKHKFVSKSFGKYMSMVEVERIMNGDESRSRFSMSNIFS